MNKSTYSQKLPYVSCTSQIQHYWPSDRLCIAEASPASTEPTTDWGNGFGSIEINRMRSLCQLEPLMVSSTPVGLIVCLRLYRFYSELHASHPEGWIKLIEVIWYEIWYWIRWMIRKQGLQGCPSHERRVHRKEPPAQTSHANSNWS